MNVKLPNAQDYDYSKNPGSNDSPTYKVVGWELNARHKPGPRWVNLRPLLDQNHLAIQAADLNLKLMKWRMIPDLDVDMLQNNCRVLLLGAGTLGCSVARTLLGWGIRDFTFVDYGNVSYSNPVRQVLFTLEDCHYDHGQGKPKAQAAADALREIAADVKSEGIRLSIPMPGHASENDESLQATVARLDQLIRETDVVFLLTDTRESRWLPTVMAAVHDKILINAALGLDSWLVMRHGGGWSPEDKDNETPGKNGRLGCYFCNDVVAPENSTKNRTLDQQCTVTRPGLAPIASSMAVELLLSLLHHPKKQRAPGTAAKSAGTYSQTDRNSDETDTSPLGVVPHQIRGSIVTYTMMTPCVPAFFCCTGCSLPVLEAYRADKFSLVGKACASMDGSYLENLSGLTAFRAKAAETLADLDDLDWDDDESEGEL
jgi:ubiquitin-like modifier-activating enzyme ATG7